MMTWTPAGHRAAANAPAFLLFVIALLTAGAASATNDEGCLCPAIYSPVCAGGKTFSSACQASCAGKKVDYIGQCADPSGCAAVLCEMSYAPVCGADSKTYGNRCMAACTGVTILYDGECNPSGKPKGSADAFPSCPPGPSVQCFVDPCTVSTITGEVASASPAVCRAHPTATCHSNYCQDAVYRGTPLQPCAAVWTDPKTGNIVDCGEEVGSAEPKTGPVDVEPKPEPKPEPQNDKLPECPPDASVQCLVDPCTVSISTTSSDSGTTTVSPPVCRAHPTATCHSNYCLDAAYRGTPLQPCSAVWLDDKTGAIVDCNSEPASTDGSSGGVSVTDPEPSCMCAEIYQPVCATTDGGASLATYPNLCYASCEGAKVVYIGKCADPAGCAAVSCLATYKPVCGADGETYSNDCNAGCTGVTIVRQGACGAQGPTTTYPRVGSVGGSESDDGALVAEGPVCDCPEPDTPVCAKKGAKLITYAGKCEATCAKATIKYEGNCADPAGCATVRCMTEEDLKCGNDGVTYRNECFAACTGVTFTDGACAVPTTTTTNKGAKKGGKKGGKKADRKGGRKMDLPAGAAGKVDASKCAHCEGEPLDPVCGSKYGITYGSACLARCSGEAQFTKGECPPQ